MSNSNPLLWPRPPVMVSYGIAILSVAAAIIIGQVPALHLQAAPVSLFLCAVMFSAWFGGVGPGLLAILLSVLAFDYYVLPPIYSLTLKPEEIPRLVIFALSALFVGSLSAAQRSAAESLRRGRDELEVTGQELKRINEALRAENADRKRIEDALQQSEAYLTEAQRLSHTGSFGWSVLSSEIYWSEETYRIFEYDRTAKPTLDLVMQRVHPDDRTRLQETLDRASNEKTNFDTEHRLLMPVGAVKYLHVVAHALQDSSGNLEFVGAVMDVTAAKQAEEALRTSEQQWRDVFENNPTMYFMIDAEGTIMAVNPFGAEQLGYAVNELISQPVLSVFYEFDRQAIQRNVALCLSQLGQSMSWELRKVRKDGSVFWVRETARAVLRANEPVVLIASEDITARRSAEEKIRQQELELRQLFDLTPQHVAVLGRDRSRLLLEASPNINQAALDYHGVTLEEWQNADPRRFFHPDDWQRLMSEDRSKFLSGSPFENEARLLGSDGKYRWFLFHHNPMRDEQGRLTRWYVAATDIEDRKQAEILLAGEKRLLEMIARGDSRALILEALCRLVEELTSGALSSILLLDPNANRLRHGAAPSLPINYTEAIDGLVIGPSVGSCGTAAYRAEPVIVSDIATDPLWAAYRDLALAHGLRACWSTPILSSDGRVLGTFAIYYREPRSPTPQDHNVIEQITHLASIAVEREQAEEALHKAQSELAHVTRVTTLGELTASIAHEVNQPLSAIVTNGSACLRWLAGDSPNLDEAREVARRIIRDGQRAGEVISRIRAMLQKTNTQKARLDINDTIRDIVALAQGEVSRNHVTLRMELAADLPPVLGDRVQLQQVILNLLMNGVEAMAAGSDRPRELLIQSQAHESDKVLIAVQDSGIGLDRENLEKIFDAFYSTKTQGMGMGLAISRSIVENHGGRLWATPNKGPGVTFQFTLPKYDSRTQHA